MKKLILSLSLLLATVAVSAQSELPSDSIPRSPSENYKEFGGFLLDMGLMSVMPPQLPKMNFDISDAGKDYNRLFRLHPDVTYSQGLSDVFSPHTENTMQTDTKCLTAARCRGRKTRLKALSN